MMLAEGLVRVDAPALPRGFQVKCTWCRSTVPTTHDAGSLDCLETSRERDISQADE